jgi:hypothetical protein
MDQKLPLFIRLVNYTSALNPTLNFRQPVSAKMALKNERKFINIVRIFYMSTSISPTMHM